LTGAGAFDLPARVPAIFENFGADAALGEHLEQDRVLEAPVDDVGLQHAALERLQAVIHLRDHPAGDHSLADHLQALRAVERREQRAVLVENALAVGQIDQLLRLERRGDGGGGGVGFRL
jgi:hypothetical protein